MKKQTNAKRNLPIFALPQKVLMYSDDQTSHRQLVTLYNPYDFSINYKVLSNNPDNYIIHDPEGTVKAHHSLDIILRHRKPSSKECFKQDDRFRVIFYESYGEKYGPEIGTAQFKCVLLEGSKSGIDHLGSKSGRVVDDGESFLPTQNAFMSNSSFQRSVSGGSSEVNLDVGMKRPSFIYVSMALICIIGLSFPDHSSKSIHLPWWLHTSENQRLVAAYILGLLTLVLFRS